MNSDKNYIAEMTARYVYAATRFLPAKQRMDAQKELESLIDDMLEERVGDRAATAKDIDVILTELGDPSVFRAKYSGSEQYLIGPELFPKYLSVLRIVLATTLFGMTVAATVLAILQEANSVGFFGSWLAMIFSALVNACGAVTVIFALAQWKGGKLRDGILNTTWSPATLPQAPQKGETISRWEPVAGIVFTVLVMLLFSAFPQLMSAVLTIDGHIEVIPMFDLVVLRRMLPLFMLTFALGLLRECVRLIEGRYTARLAVVTVLSDVIALGLCFFIFGDGTVFNPEFLPRLLAVAPELAEVRWVFDRLPQLFLGVLVFAFLLDLLTDVIKAIKYRTNV